MNAPLNIADRDGDNVAAFDHASFSIKGMKRNQNGDHLYVSGNLAVIADGISSSSTGAEAARNCVAAFQDRMTDIGPNASTEQIQILLDAVNGSLLSKAMLKPSNERRRGGCCVVGVVVAEDGRTAILFHAGDAAVHLLGPDGLRRMTVDHAPADKRGRKGRVSSALGVVPSPEITIQRIDLAEGDRLILTTDGCEIDQTSAFADTPDGASARILAEALEQSVATPPPSDDSTAIIISPNLAG